jgi:uncharacterized membrane protein YeaQ/YmgE (transglycosylase-associated protein family)
VRTRGRDDWILLAWANEGVLPPGQHVEPADHLSGRDRNQDLELWKHHASTGGDDKSRMVTLASWLLGFAAAILAYLTTQFFFSEIVRPDEWLQSVVVATVGAVISLAGAYIAVLYGGYANRNWRAADVIAWRHGWLDLLPEVDRASGESNKPSRVSRLLSTGWWHLRRRHPLISLDDYAWHLARPARPDRLAPVFEAFCIFSLLAFSAHVLVGLYSLGQL